MEEKERIQNYYIVQCRISLSVYEYPDVCICVCVCVSKPKNIYI